MYANMMTRASYDIDNSNIPTSKLLLHVYKQCSYSVTFDYRNNFLLLLTWISGLTYVYFN